MIYPENIRTGKQKTFYWLLRQWQLFDYGRGAVIGKFTGMIPSIGIGILLVEKYTKIEVGAVLLTIVLITMFFICWTIGRYWRKSGADKIEQQISAERNPLLSDIHKSTVKEREQI